MFEAMNERFCGIRVRSGAECKRGEKLKKPRKILM